MDRKTSHHRSQDGRQLDVTIRDAAAAGPSTSWGSRGHSPDRIQIGFRQRTVVVSDAENSSDSASNRRRHAAVTRRKSRRRRTQRTIRRSSDEFQSINSCKCEFESSGRPSQSHSHYCSWDGERSRQTRTRNDPRVIVSKSEETPAVTVKTKTTCRRRRNRGTRSRSRSVEIRFQVPPSESQAHCSGSQRQRVAAAPCYPCRDTGYHPSHCESASSRESSQKSKCVKKVAVYCPEKESSGDGDSRPECWTEVAQRCIEDQKICPCPKESTLDVTIITDMQGSTNIPAGGRRLSTDHHERLGKHMDNLNRRENPMDDNRQTEYGRVDRDFGQKLDATRENEQVIGRNRYRRESMEPSHPGASDEPERQPEVQNRVAYPASEQRPGPSTQFQQSTKSDQPGTSGPGSTQQRSAAASNQPSQSASRPQPLRQQLARQTISDYKIRLTEETTEDPPCHMFPFQDTPSGNIKIDKRLVSFENNKIAVLVAKPDKTRVSIKQDRHGAPPPPPPPPAPCQPLPSPPPEPEPTCNPPPVIWDEPRFRDYQDEPPPTCTPRRNQSTSCSRERTCMPIPPPEHRRSSSPGPGCDAKGCKIRSNTPNQNRQSFAYSTEHTRCSKDLMENIHYRLKTACNPDSKIRIGEKTFPCHALALQCYSKYFDKLKRPKDKILEMEIPESVISPQYFPNLMDWILIEDKDKLLAIDKENAVNLFSAAVFLQIPDLRRDCLDFVKTKVEAADPSIIKMYEQAREKENCGELVTLLASKLSTLFPQLYKSKQFLHMDVKELILILSADNIMIKSEIEVFDAAARWLLYDWENRRQFTVSVMKTVRFGLLSPLQLAQMKHSPGDENLPAYAQLFTYETVHKLMDDGLAFAVFRENYKGRSGELNRWVKRTGIVAPRFRHNLDEEPDVTRLPAAVTFDSEREDEGQQRRSSLRSREATPSPRRRRASISEEVTEKSIKTLGENNVGVSRFSRAHSNDYQEEEPDPREIAARRASWRDPENSTVASHVANRMSVGSNNQADDEGSWMNAEYGQEHVEAAVLIQSNIRGWSARKRYKTMKQAARLLHSSSSAHRSDLTEANMKSSRNRRSSKHSSLTESIPPRVRKLDLKDSDAVIIFGGSNPNIPIGEGNDPREIYQLNPITNQWKFMGLMPEPRTHVGAVHMSGNIIIFGGADPRYRTARDKPKPCSSTWSLNMETGGWKMLANMTEAKTGFGYAVLNGRIFVFGGVNIDGQALSSCESYDPQYDSWNPIVSMDGPRVGLFVTQFDDKIWIAGGLTKDPRLPMLKTVIVYDVKKNSFFPAPSLPKPRCYATMTSYYDRLFIFAGAGTWKKGETNHSLSDVLCLEDGEWKVFGNMKTARHGQCQVKLGKYLLLIGGVSSVTQSALNTVESFNMEKGTVSTRLQPMPRALSGVAGLVLH